MSETTDTRGAEELEPSELTAEDATHPRHEDDDAQQGTDEHLRTDNDAEASSESPSQSTVSEEIPGEQAEPSEATQAEAKESQASGQPRQGANTDAAEAPGEGKADQLTTPTPEQEGNLTESNQSEPTTELSQERRQVLAPFLMAAENKSRMTGRVIGWNKGGFHVVIEGQTAFCPKSQMEIGNPRSPSRYVNLDLEFQVREIRDAGRRIVLTRVPILKQERQTLLAELQRKMREREPIDGKVTSITEFGAFVDLGGIEGLVHLSQLSRQRVERVSEAVKLGQEVVVLVTRIEKKGDRISLSMKALEPDPWEEAGTRWTTGTQFEGKVARAADFGLFVELEPSVEGLLHESQLPPGKNVTDEEYQPGSPVTGWIRDVDPERKRISLTMREVAATDPWPSIKERFSEGEKITGLVEDITKFGVFVQLEPGLSGLLPFSSVSTPAGGRPQRQFRPGQKIEVQIDSIDARRRRISLVPVGSRLEGTRADFQAFKKSDQTADGKGLNAMAAAFAKLRDGSDDS